jgi:hypothetical protein
LIRELLAVGCEVIIASEGAQKVLLQEEFPLLNFLELPGYQIVYRSSGWRTKWMLMMQIPRILSAIRYEHQWLKKHAEKQHFDIVISDNRYGLYHEHIRCIFITHQLLIKTSFGPFPDRLLQRLNYRFIKHFRTCWVPDYKETDNLAGELSNPKTFPSVPVEYIGPLSRFPEKEVINHKKHILALVSGPEPQRTIFEQLLIKQLEYVNEPAILLRGLPGKTSTLVPKNPLLKIFNHLHTDTLQELIGQSKVVVCRSGYSSIMDLIPQGVSCAFIPTPGQPEQIYLAEYLASKQLCLSYQQASFNIEVMLKDVQSFHPLRQDDRGSRIKEVISKTLNEMIAGG